jgi:RNA polymerase sigma factor (TIGR02999 family)
MSETTELLNRLQADEVHEEELIVSVYNELRRMAGAKMALEPKDHTLQPTALVHEVWLRLVARSRKPWENKAEFFAAAGEAMRRILIDHARRKQSLKRGGGSLQEPLDEQHFVLAVPPEELLAVDEALEELAQQDSQLANLVKLRYYVGMSVRDAASSLGMPQRAAERMWTFARAWLRHRIRKRS